MMNCIREFTLKNKCAENNNSYHGGHPTIIVHFHFTIKLNEIF